MNYFSHFELSGLLKFIKNLIDKLLSTDSGEINLILLVISILIISYIINILMMYSVGGVYRIFVAPGVILHELSHALACLITGAKISSIDVFKKDGGEIKHTAPKVPIVGQIVISVAPLVIGALAIYFISKVVGVNTNQSEINIMSFSDLVENIKNIIKFIDFRSLRSWLAFYLIISIAITMTPSTRDLRNMILSVVTVAIFIYLAIKYLNLSFSMSMLLKPEFLAVLYSCVVVLIVALFLSIIITLLAMLAKR